MYSCSPVFSNSLTNVLVEELGCQVSEVLNILSISGVATNNKANYPNWKLLRHWLNNSGVDSRWNNIFDNKRPIFIAEWIKPYINRKSVLDLLCGNGLIGNILSRNFNVSFMEHLSHYNVDKKNYNGIIYDFADRDQLKEDIEVVIIIASLHHELKPLEVIEYAAKIAKTRIIIIENTITPLYDHSYQIIMDYFFNSCLSESKLPNPGNHNTAEKWVDIVESYHAKLVLMDYKSRIPGIPMPHELMIFDVHK